MNESKKIYLLDNYDSFTYNVEHGLIKNGAKVLVQRADECTISFIEQFNPDIIIISPGPGSPEESTKSLKIIDHFKSKIPIFGICLGMQCIITYFGGKVSSKAEPYHGKTSVIENNAYGIFSNTDRKLNVARYHSLSAVSIPNELVQDAQSEDGICMAVHHKEFKVSGVQFHPESFLTEFSDQMMENIINVNF